MEEAEQPKRTEENVARPRDPSIREGKRPERIVQVSPPIPSQLFADDGSSD